MVLLVSAVLLALFALANAVLAMLLWDLGRRDGEDVPAIAVVLVAGGVVAAAALLVARPRRVPAVAVPLVVAATSGLACLWLGPF